MEIYTVVKKFATLSPRSRKECGEEAGERMIFGWLCDAGKGEAYRMISRLSEG